MTTCYVDKEYDACYMSWSVSIETHGELRLYGKLHGIKFLTRFKVKCLNEIGDA